MTQKPQLSLADYVVILISPVLIIGMVNSLMFFLILLLGLGQAEGMFNWIIFWFGVAIVLICRISIEISSERAVLYGAALSIAVWFTAGGPGMFDYGLTMMAVLAVVWWAAHRLTYDCTVVDESRDASGQGLLDAANLDGTSGEEDRVESAEANSKKKKKKRTRQSGFLGWLERYRDYREKRANRPHALGVWVVYFSLAALPLYGLGQSFLPAEDLERRRYAFWLMSIYVACGLGLLMTTSFLSLRRYLRQRKLRMPAAITGVWLTIGGGLILGLLIAGALLPRPNAEYAVSDLAQWASTDDREASKYSPLKEGDAKGEGKASQSKSENKTDAKPGDGTQKSNEGKTRQNPDADSSQNKQGEKPKDSGQSSAGKPSESGNKPADKGADNKAKGEPSSGDKNSDSQDGSQSSESKDWFKPIHSMAEGLGPILKFIVYGVAILAGLYILLRFLANFTGWAQGFLDSLRAFWESLFGGKKEVVTAEEGAEAVAELFRPRPFSDFPNPFRLGMSQKSPEQLVRYSFEALQSWAWERGFGRKSDETPLEFADRLGENVPGLRGDFQRLAELYAQACYARGRLPAACTPVVKQFWQRLTTLGYEVPQTAGAPVG